MKKKTKKKLRAIQKRVLRALRDYDAETEVVYVFVRKDIPIFAQAVQAAHACLEAGRLFHDDFGRNTAHIILLKCKDEEQLLRAQRLCGYDDIRCHMFFEPEMESLGNERTPGFTALATEPLSKNSYLDTFQEFDLWDVR